uniref:Piwi domain-containing protein n=1 Tax=Heterorhabditis bacteriophora TaxID=37862 RepID=A0A1I7XPK2_HETBA
MPSVLGWGANCTDNPQKYLGDYEYIAPRQPDVCYYLLITVLCLEISNYYKVFQMLGNSLEKLLVRILKKFRAARNVPPQHIIIYFSGVSEGQWTLVSTDISCIHTIIPFLSIAFQIPSKYLLAMKKGIRSLSEQYKPKLTALALSKEHNERIYRKANDSNCTPDFLEGLTHGLCYLHEIITATVSVPVPLVVADRCAKRGHDVWIAYSDGSRDCMDSIEEANQKLTNNKPNGALQNVRYNA